MKHQIPKHIINPSPFHSPTQRLAFKSERENMKAFGFKNECV